MNLRDSLKGIIRSGRESFAQHDSTILIVTGLVGTAASMYLMHEATKKATKKIEAKEKELGRELTFKEKAKETYKDYAPAAIMLLASDSCIIAGHHKDISKGAAAYAAYRISEETVEKLDKQLDENLGERKAQKLRNEANEEKMREVPLPDDSAIIMTGNGNYLIFDMLSKRYFRSSIAAIQRGITNANQQMQDEMYLTYVRLP